MKQILVRVWWLQSGEWKWYGTATFQSDFTSTTGWTQNSSSPKNIAISTGK